MPLYDNEGKKTEKFILSVSPDQLKAVLTLTGDAITQAVSDKLNRNHHKYSIKSIFHFRILALSCVRRPVKRNVPQ